MQFNSQNTKLFLSDRQCNCLSNPNHKLNMFEEHHRRHAVQIRRNERQLNRLRELRMNEAISRNNVAAINEYHFQVVRLRKYYQEFVNQFRLRKMQKTVAEEMVSRLFGTF